MAELVTVNRAAVAAELPVLLAGLATGGVPTTGLVSWLERQDVGDREGKARLTTMKIYTPDEIRTLTEERFAPGATEPYRCPACGEMEVRIRQYASTHGEVTKSMGYAWCRASRHYTGWTSEYRPELDDVLEKLPEEQQQRFRELSLDGDLDGMFEILDSVT